MVNAEQIKALIQSHAEGDDTRFFAVAMQIAALEARSGRAKLAESLRDVIDRAREEAGKSTGHKTVAMVEPRGELAGVLAVSYSKARLADMTLEKDVSRRIERVLHEQRERERIREHGLDPLRKLLLIGPPGTGKTMTARVLAGELGLPLFTVQLDGLITKFMGETAAKLRLVFDAVHRRRAVYLFDEFDALGGERAAKNDVGEIRRVLNSFLQFLEQDASDSLVLAATNHALLLDRALFRRFDSVIHYGLPSTALIEKLARGRLALIDTSEVDWTLACSAAEGLSHADVVHACEQAAKRSLLDHHKSLSTEPLVEALNERRSGQA